MEVDLSTKFSKEGKETTGQTNMQNLFDMMEDESGSRGSHSRSRKEGDSKEEEEENN